MNDLSVTAAHAVAGDRSRLSTSISKCYRTEPSASLHCEIGVLKGEGIGPEVVDATLRVLAAVNSVSDATFSVNVGGCIGLESVQLTGRELSDEVISFCESTFARGGAVLSGPGGGRYVYEMRKHFDLFCKFNPLRPHAELRTAGRLKPEFTDGVDVLVVRENAAGVYQGQWAEETSPVGNRSATHRFSYSGGDVTRIVEIAAKIARRRRGKLAVVVKPNGIPSVSDLWLACAGEVAADYDVELTPLEIDYAAYRLIQDAGALDVVVTPNLFGDILSDLGGVLLGSRGLCYAGSFSASGRAVYQTNHGAAHDLAGSDRANPVAQMLSLSMMLRESFGCLREAALIERAVYDVWRKGYRTDDLLEPNCRAVGTREMGERTASAIARLAEDGD